jgi:hypothetical protein
MRTGQTSRATQLKLKNTESLVAAPAVERLDLGEESELQTLGRR